MFCYLMNNKETPLPHEMETEMSLNVKLIATITLSWDNESLAPKHKLVKSCVFDTYTIKEAKNEHKLEASRQRLMTNLPTMKARKLERPYVLLIMWTTLCSQFCPTLTFTSTTRKNTIPTDFMRTNRKL